MATFDVSGVLYRDPETGCASTSGNQVAYEECRQSFYAKQQSEKTNTAPTPVTTSTEPNNNSALNLKIDSLEHEVQKLQTQQSIPAKQHNVEQYYPHIIVGLLIIILGMLVFQAIQSRVKK